MIGYMRNLQNLGQGLWIKSNFFPQTYMERVDKEAQCSRTFELNSRNISGNTTG